MKITICGSIAFIDEMQSVKKELEKLGHEVQMPPLTALGLNGQEIDIKEYYKIKKTLPAEEAFWHNHTKRITDHFDKVAWSDAVLITNYDKNGIVGYIGPNTLMEMGLGLHLGKKIFLLNPVPDVQWKEEVLGMRPIVINNDLSKIA